MPLRGDTAAARRGIAIAGISPTARAGRYQLVTETAPPEPRRASSGTHAPPHSIGCARPRPQGGLSHTCPATSASPGAARRSSTTHTSAAAPAALRSVRIQEVRVEEIRGNRWASSVHAVPAAPPAQCAAQRSFSATFSKPPQLSSGKFAPPCPPAAGEPREHARSRSPETRGGFNATDRLYSDALRRMQQQQQQQHEAQQLAEAVERSRSASHPQPMPRKSVGHVERHAERMYEEHQRKADRLAAAVAAAQPSFKPHCRREPADTQQRVNAPWNRSESVPLPHRRPVGQPPKGQPQANGGGECGDRWRSGTPPPRLQGMRAARGQAASAQQARAAAAESEESSSPGPSAAERLAARRQRLGNIVAAADAAELAIAPPARPILTSPQQGPRDTRSTSTQRQTPRQSGAPYQPRSPSRRLGAAGRRRPGSPVCGRSDGGSSHEKYSMLGDSKEVGLAALDNAAPLWQHG
eukprot:TRINITY_DN4356_c1_g1_i1.p1 TRINITY_DN4356_c1_g1~~TRINITY_DN4356_c1_g1_i1.p1  ORF type:complete len:502 (+),score=87.62 TRINITY_DN4356_c1_g1_i1:104-1507(+)